MDCFTWIAPWLMPCHFAPRHDGFGKMSLHFFAFLTAKASF
jgi:hypothetical protein